MVFPRRAKVDPRAQLSRVVQEMPVSIAAAMLTGVQQVPLICGAYVEKDGDGVCALVAANRAGSPGHRPTDIARAWDEYCGVRPGEWRLATHREKRTLIRLLEDRVFPGRERDCGPRERCGGCGRRLHVDFHGACACCAAPAYEARPLEQPAEAVPAADGSLALSAA